jgi:hypothetical protein
LLIFTVLEGLETSSEKVGVRYSKVVAREAHALGQTDVIGVLDCDEIRFHIREDIIERNELTEIAAVVVGPYDWSTSRTLSVYSGCGPSSKVSHTFLAESPP